MIFKGNYINKCMGDSSNGSKTLTQAWLLHLEVKLQEATDD